MCPASPNQPLTPVKALSQVGVWQKVPPLAAGEKVALKPV